ncbi:MAG: LptE family protein, partial [Candidatus Marinimicrobia bacterium]|nr:LptE family protein [Candidatus Neomarinimicrobiota bacterium]
MEYNVKKICLHVILFCLLFFTGCGIYSVRPGTIPPGIKSIAIEDVVNETAEFNLGQHVTAALINRILSENILPLAEPEAAHSILRVSLTRITDDPYTFDETETVKEYKLTLTARYEWLALPDNRELMKGTLSQWSVYYSDSYNNQLSPSDQITREDALQDVVEKTSQ